MTEDPEGLEFLHRINESEGLSDDDFLDRLGLQYSKKGKTPLERCIGNRLGEIAEKISVMERERKEMKKMMIGNVGMLKGGQG